MRILLTSGITNDLLDGSTDVLGSAAVSRCMVGQSQIVVDRLRASDKFDIAACQKRIIRKLFDGIHRIISADIDKCFNIKLIQQRKNLIIDRFILVDLRKFIAAGPQKSCRCSLQNLTVKIILDVLGQIDIIAFHQSLNTMTHPVYFLCSTLDRCVVNTCQTRINDCSRSAGLPDNDISLHTRYLLIIY